MRKLESYNKAVLVEYIYRQGVEPIGLDEIERELNQPMDAAVPMCKECQGGAIIAANMAARWCTCSAADKLRAKVPKFVDEWNARWEQPQNQSVVKRRFNADTR